VTTTRRQPPDLRLIVITDRVVAHPRSVIDIVQAALAAGAPAIQLRDKKATAREMFEAALALKELTSAAGALLFVNDRLDVALAAGADGAHLGPTDLPIAEARAVVPPDFLLGYSTDQPDAARAAVRAGADYIGCGAVFGTRNKAEVGDERIGTGRLAEVVKSVDVPVIGIGGIRADNIADVAATGAAGAAVIGAVMAAADPAAAVARLLEAFRRGSAG